jgi:hypothetical protein
MLSHVVLWFILKEKTPFAKYYTSDENSLFSLTDLLLWEISVFSRGCAPGPKAFGGSEERYQR